MREDLHGMTATAAQWHATLPPPLFASPRTAERLFSLRRYVETPAEMRQPALSEPLLVMHLGGAKRVRRTCAGRLNVHEVDLGALTVMPARRETVWLTEGPIDFAHLTVARSMLSRVLLEEFDRDPDRCELAESVGMRNACIEQIFHRLLAITERGSSSRLHLESLLVVLTVELLTACLADRPVAGSSQSAMPHKGGLAGWRLKRVCDYMSEHLGGEVSLADLAALAGLSRAQFFRAFRQSTGSTPGRFLTRLRMDRARAAIETTRLEIAQVGETVGIANGARFAALFKARFGVTPRSYRHTRI